MGLVTPDNVFKVCDQPHPILVRQILAACQKGDIDVAMEKLDEIWGNGYAAVDIVTTLFRVTKTMDSLPEALKLEFIKEIGWTHMRILEGVSTVIQLGACLARLCKMVSGVICPRCLLTDQKGLTRIVLPHLHLL